MNDSKLEQAKLLIKSISLSLPSDEHSYELHTKKLDAFIKAWCECDSPPTEAELKVVQNHLKHVIDEVNTDLSDRLGTEIEDALSKANAMEVPFEAEIIASNPDGNARVAALITALRTVEGTLEEVFEAMGFTVPVPE